MKDKIIFKLTRIIIKNIANKIELKPFEFFLEAVGPIEISASSNQVKLAININLIKNSTMITKWQQKFLWKNKLHYTKHNPNKPLNVVKKSSNLVLNVNKRMFSNWLRFTTGWNLFYYVKGQLEEIALDFKIAPQSGVNMDLPLKNNDFLAHIYFNEQKVFAVNLTENTSSIKYDTKSLKKHRTKKHHVSKCQDLIISQVELEICARNLLVQMKLKFSGLWSKNDRIGEVTKSAKTLLYDIYGPEFAKDVSITSNFAASTKLKTIIDENNNLNFTWIISTFNALSKYENIVTRTIEIEDQLSNFKDWLIHHPYNFDSNFLFTKLDLFKFLTQKATTIDYSLIVRTVDDGSKLTDSLRVTDFDLDFYDSNFDFNCNCQEREIATFSYEHLNLWKMFFIIKWQSNIMTPEQVIKAIQLMMIEEKYQD